MKLNLGSGYRKLAGATNVDFTAALEPDIVHDLTVMPWPFEENSVDEFHFRYSLEEIGHSPEQLLNVVKEVYRLARPGARVLIDCLHPRSDRFVLNPLAQHRLSPQFFRLLSKTENLNSIASQATETALALQLGVDFEVVKGTALLKPELKTRVDQQLESIESLVERAAFENNIVEAYEIELRVVKR